MAVHNTRIKHQTRMKDPIKEKVALIQALDLSFLEKKLLSTLKWSDSKAKDSIRRYKNFLVLCYKYPQEKHPPTKDIDEVWHAHILHTVEYFRDCNAIFGKYLHHSPFNDTENLKAVSEMSNFYYRAAELYIQEFQESYSLELDIATFW